MPCRLPAKPGWRLLRCSSTVQNSSSAIGRSRSRLACERLLRLGGVAPRMADSGPECKPQGVAHVIESDGVRQLRVEQADHVAPRRKVRAFSSTRVSRASWAPGDWE